MSSEHTIGAENVDSHKGTKLNGHQSNGNHINGHQPNGYPNKDHRTNGYHNSEINGSYERATAASGTSGHSERQDDALYEPIAIIGCAVRLPGQVDDTEAFWDMLINKREGRILVPDSRYNIEAFHSPGKPKAGQVATKYGHFLDHVDLTQMDTSFWLMHGKEMEELDPQQRLALEVSYECLQNSGTTKFKGSNTGSFWGLYGEDWQDMRAKDTQHPSLYYITGALDFAISNRVSYEFGLTGPSMVIRTACSSSLTALHEACMSIQSGDCESALVGGVNVILAPYMTASMTEFGVLSPEGRCKTFDAGANGYARGEGCVVLHIKKLSDAIRNNDPVRAVIRGSCTNSDGRTFGLTQPNPASHAALIRRSHAIAGLEVAQTAMIECHGTGTPVGDPIETKAVAEAFGKAGAYIGSVKPNVGHSEGASGVTSILKAMLALEKRIIPPNRNFDTPHPNIPWEEANLIVPVEPTLWPTDRAERIGVNSFGIGGANAHVLLESATSAGVPDARRRMDSGKDSQLNDEPRLLTFSATTPESLKRLVESHEAYIKASPKKLDDLSYTLNVRREPLPYRAFVVVNQKMLSSDKALQPSSSERGTGQVQVAFVFTGQGAQWPEMGAQLLHRNAIFRETIQILDTELSKCRPAPSWSLNEELLKPTEESRVGVAQFSQPLCTAVQIGLVNVLRDWGVYPEAVVGHSSGEIGAAYASKALSAEDAIRVAYYRGLATVDIDNSKGGMAAIGMGRAAVSSFLVPGVIIGCENSPESVTLSGDADKLVTVMDSIRSAHPDVLVRKLRIDRAYHSHHMAAIAREYETLISKVKASVPEIPFFSSVTGAQLLGEKIPLGASYWTRNLTSPVLFSPAVSALLQHMSRTSSSKKPLLLEVGPHSALAGPLRQVARAEAGTGGAKYKYVETLMRGSNDVVALLETAGKLFQSNTAINLSSLSPTEGSSVLRDLPLYPWHRTGPYWSESRISRSARQRQFPQHDVLGIRMWASAGSNLTWRNVMRLDDVPWVREHDISGDVVFPGAGYVAMVGEAARQTSGLDDYTVREMNLVNALVLHDDKETEVITTLKPVRLTSSLNSPTWYDFEVSSCNQGTETWVVHAFGQVRGGHMAEASLDQNQLVQPLSRRIPSSRWYNVMRRFGLNYGPRFQGLVEITADPVEKKAVAFVKNEHSNLELNESHYAIHPAAIDTVFQALGVAAFQGQSRNYNQLSVPSFIGELYVKPVDAKFQLQLDAGVTARGSLFGNAVGLTAEHGIVLKLKDIRMSSLGDGDTGERDQDPHAAVELVWKPDINLVDNHTLFHHQEDFSSLVGINERLALSCMIQNYHLIEDLDPSLEFMNKYRSWLRKVQQQALDGKYPNVPDCKEIAQMTSEEREKLIKDTFEYLKESKAWPVATAIHRMLRSCQEIFTGAADAVDILLEDDILSRIYDFGRVCDFADFFSLAAHYRPNLKILEIGAGTGGTTSSILPVLKSEYGERMYYSYTYTDVSNGFFMAAKDRFQDFEAIDYRVLDISTDPLDQGFEECSFDVIVASNVLHATPNLYETLTNVHKLLAPKGRLFLQELWPPTKWINYIMGALPGWWLGKEDGRPEEPYISPSDWEQRLVAAGFKVDTTFDDQQLNSYMIAVPGPTERPTSTLTLLHLGALTLETEGIKTALESAGYDVQLCDFFETPEAYQDIVVSVVDVDKPFIHDISEGQFDRLKVILAELKQQNSRILWVTGAAQINCQDPRYGMTLGLSRVIRTEYELDFASLELDRFDSTSWSAVVDVLREFQSLPEDDGEDLKPTMEWALSDGVVNVGRFHWTSVNNELAKEPGTARKLDITKRGFLSTLQWDHFSPPDLQPRWVRIKNEAVGLNFKDVLISMGIVEGDGLGCECAGTVLEIGPGVSTVSVGDRVMIIAPGSFATTLETHESVCAKIPDDLSSTEGASMPVVYCTAIRALMDQAQLEKGQSVLIHSACGGVGIAALYIAKYIGAEIYCTVGTEDKINHLMREFDIPSDRIFNSRDSSFKRDLLAKTNGRGVDVVLNSLSGELLHASWDCVARFGHMIEIGKRDLIGKGALSLAPFEQNRSYIGVDLGDIMFERPQVGARLLRTLSSLLQQGHVKPIRPTTLFEGAKVEDSMRFMQKGDHIGKVVVTIPEQPEELDVKPILPQKPSLMLDGESSYLFVGGLGGLGQAVAIWLAESGAKEIIFLSRSAGAAGKYDGIVQELKILGCSSILVSGSVSEEQDVERAVKSTSRNIRGVLQASMVLRDRNLPSMTFEDWQTATMPKVKGTWNLHHVLEKEKHTVDFFIVFSSWSGLVGQPGQGNYAAGNTFLDAFVQYRRSQGLAAAVIDFGPVDDVGYVSQSERLLDFFRMTSTYVLYEQDILDSIHLLMARSQSSLTSNTHTDREKTQEIGKRQFVNKTQLALGLRSTQPLSAPGNRTTWKRDPRMALYRNLEAESTVTVASTRNEKVHSLLSVAEARPSILDAEENVVLLAEEIGRTLIGFTMKDDSLLDINQAPSAMGIDSLVAIELRNWFRKSLGIDITVLEVLGSDSLLALGRVSAGKLKARYLAASVDQVEHGYIGDFMKTKVV